MEPIISFVLKLIERIINISSKLLLNEKFVIATIMLIICDKYNKSRKANQEKKGAKVEQKPAHEPSPGSTADFERWKESQKGKEKND